MRKQDQLVQLIASLSPNEKRYFKLFSIQPGEKKYLELFDVLEGEGSYQSSVLSEKLGISPSRLAVEKAYLTKALQRSLVHYDEDLTEANYVFHSYLEANSLAERRLFESALDIVDKALAKAWQMEMFNFIHSLLALKTGCMYALHKFDEMPGLVNECSKANAASLEFFEMQALRGQATDCEMRRDDKTGFAKLLEHPLLEADVESYQSVRSQTAWFDIMFRYYVVANQDNGKILDLARRHVDLYERRSQIKIINPFAYLTAYTRLASAEMEMKNYAGGLEVTMKLASILADTSLPLAAAKLKAVKFFTNTLIATFKYHLQQYDEATNLFARLLPTVNEGGAYEQYHVVLYYAAALMHSGRTDEALDKVNQLLQMKTDSRKDLQSYARVIMIMLQADLGNEEMLPFLVRTTKAWMKRNEIVDPEIMLLLGIIYPLAKTPVLERDKVWQKMLNAISNDTLAKVDEVVQLRRWAGGKVFNKKSSRTSLS